MASMIIHHRVRDYAAWRPGYDAHESSRVAAGITDGRVYRNADDPNDIVIVANVSDPDKARAWTASDDLKTAMQKAGVLGAPTIHLIG
jgi:hypothetical protein